MGQLKFSGIALLTIWKLLFHGGKIKKVLIYKYKTDLQAAKAILPNGIIIKVTTHKESDFFYKIHAEKKSFLCLITITHRTYPLKKRNIFIKESLFFLLLHPAFKRIQKSLTTSLV